ncbi:MAG TPA: transcription elongation factor GreA [Candidatus Paceibacterota bacterium]
MNQYYVSPERLVELRKELEELRTVKRVEVAEHLKRAKEYGDLSENAEYSEAKDEQAKLETRIAGLEDFLKKAVVIEKTGIGDRVQVGSTVTIKKGKDTFTYNIVGSNESKPEEGKISNESPIGRALIDRRIGEEVTIVTPSGKTTYEVLKIG